MQLKEFDYNLPEKLIAQKPMEPRDNSRLLVLDKKSGKIEHHTFYDIVDYLNEGDLLVVNNSKVFPARLFGKRKDTGGKVEILLNKKTTKNNFVVPASHSVIPAEAGIQSGFPIGVGNDEQTSVWEVIGKNLKVGIEIVFENSELEAKVLEKNNKLSNIKFNMKDKSFFSEIEKIGHTPLPPYIKKNDTKKDKTDYQTVYAKPVGSAAAPTAGLHFTRELLNKIKAKGVEIIDVTLHVGLGTFAPVEEDNIEDHKIHSEYYTVIPENIKKIIQAKKDGHRIIAVGTTSTRVLETIFNSNCHPEHIRQTQCKIREGSIMKDSLSESTPHCIAGTQNDKYYSGWTDIFIYPGYEFKCIDGLITNFHLPKSTLLMLVSAFTGKKNVDAAYKEAIDKEYRFFSYGDAMLIV